jgi:hypothetical protein
MPRAYMAAPRPDEVARENGSGPVVGEVGGAKGEARGAEAARGVQRGKPRGALWHAPAKGPRRRAARRAEYSAGSGGVCGDARRGSTRPRAARRCRGGAAVPAARGGSMAGGGAMPEALPRCAVSPSWAGLHRRRCTRRSCCCVTSLLSLSLSLGAAVAETPGRWASRLQLGRPYLSCSRAPSEAFIAPAGRATVSRATEAQARPLLLAPAARALREPRQQQAMWAIATDAVGCGAAALGAMACVPESKMHTCTPCPRFEA